MKILNINLGVMGHVDCGKTSLCKKLSDVASTAAFDKNPQSQERGITIDLGFSCIKSTIPEHLKHLGYETLQITLVDCPGHASLFKTVIGGSNIIDMILLVVDVTHGIQIQTAECIILAEILKKPIIVALNKVDLLNQPEPNYTKNIDKIRKILSKTQLEIIEILPVSISNPSLLEGLKNFIVNNIRIPIRSEGNFLLCVDHCFSIKGKGTVMTGTVIQGTLKVNDPVLIIDHNEIKDVKSIQVFKESVNSITQGDRAGLLVTRFNSNLIERSLICSPKHPYKYSSTLIISPHIIQHYKNCIKSKSKVVVSVGFEVVTALVLFYEKPDDSHDSLFIESLSHDKSVSNRRCLMKVEKPVMYFDDSVVIGLNLSVDQTKKTCRFMFHGNLIPFNEFVYVWKTKIGQVEKENGGFVIVKRIFTQKSNIQKHFGQKVTFSTGDAGIIDSNFGNSGKIKIKVDFNPTSALKEILASKDKNQALGIEVTYKYKKFHKISRFV